jgi:Glu-tRNA(Gln) amidotransferase subunit E-like FAD-binding protein
MSSLTELKAMAQKEKMVRVYDMDTKKVTNIPASELAPGMIRIQFRDQEGEYWVEAAKLKKSSPKQFDFGQEYIEVFEFLSETLAEVYPQTIEEWADGFRRDANPKQEIAIWENIANAFLHLSDDPQLSSEERKEIFTVIFVASTNGPENVLHTFTPAFLSKQRVRRVIEDLIELWKTWEEEGE